MVSAVSCQISGFADHPDSDLVTEENCSRRGRKEGLDCG